MRNTAVATLAALVLLAAAPVCANAGPAPSEAVPPPQHEACPLPAGATPPEEPRVTAQQVEDGSAALREFALSVRERSREHARQATTVEEGLYIGCAIRQENGIWRSGSTYIVTLTLDGRVFVHAKDMSLSGRLLDPLIYGEILSALGVSPADLADLADPAKQNSAFAAVIGTLSQEPDGAFDATAPVPGLRPGIPGAAGYAAVYNSPELQSPIVLIAGFDLNESHTVSVDDDNIDYGDPEITAAEVVDRESLKAFVTQAGRYMLEIQRAGDPAAASKAKIALRDPNGPWRHGSVYLYVLSLETNIITFHAAFPDRFENRPLTPTVRDAVTGEFILPQVIEAAKSDPEGGFVEYYFDDPTDDTDSADIPKVGYAREFTGPILGPDGSVIREVDFIVGSGFYRTAPQAVAEGGNAVIESVLPQVMRAMTAGTVDAISGRIRQASSGSPPARQASLGGASTLTDALLANRTALENGTLDLDRLLARSSFTLSLNAAEAGEHGLLRNLTVWGSGDYRSLSGGNRQSVSYDGDVASASLGIDTRPSLDLLAGVSVARAQGSVDYTDSSARKGELTTTLTSVNPYMGWQSPGGANLWAAAGYGTGEVEIGDSAGRETSDLTQRMIAGGLDLPLATSDRLIEGGTVSLSLKAETAFTWAEVDASGTLAGAKLSVSRQRLAVEGSHTRKLTSGGTFTPSIEIGMRHDGGDGETGGSVEAGGALRYADPATGLSVGGRARTLLIHSEDHEEWGLSGLIRIDPGSAGRGLALSVQPAWGMTASGVQRLWETGVAGTASPAYRAAGRVDAEVGYGLAASGGLGTVTPFAGLGLAGDGGQSWRAGTRWEVAPGARLSLAGTWREAAGYSDPGHSLTLRGVVHW